ncbi:MAG: riboflavin synthase [Actinomycetota bacterium]
MFTGIVEERGTVRALAPRFEVACADLGCAIGDSVAVNGVCLTVVAIPEGGLAFDLSEETLARTSLGRLAPADPVNLERPMRADGRFGGHIVQGHVDGVGRVVGLDRGPTGATLTVRTPADLRRYLVEKGSVAVDGVSLTVAGLDGDRFSVALIPHTLDHTTLGAARPEDPVNLEVDVIAKYVESMLDGRNHG